MSKDLGFIGRLGKTELAAAALGNTVFYLLHYPMLGVMTAIDTLLATTFGAGQLRWGKGGRGEGVGGVRAAVYVCPRRDIIRFIQHNTLRRG